MEITSKYLEDVAIPEAANGYDMDKVDELLEEIMDKLDADAAEIASLQQQLAAAKAAPAPVAQPVYAAPAKTSEASDREVMEILEMARKVKNETVAQAEADARKIVEDAQKQAEEQLGSLESERDRLTKEVADLKTVATTYRARFEELLSAQQEALEKATNLF